MRRLVAVMCAVLIFGAARSQDPRSLVTHGWLSTWAKSQAQSDSMSRAMGDSIVSARAIGPTGTPEENYVPKWSAAAGSAIWRPDSTGGGASPTFRVDLATPVLAALVWTNMPTALSFWLSTATVAKGVTKADLTNYTQVRLLVNKQGTSGAAASKLILCYKTTTFTQTVANYVDIGTSEVSVATNVNNTFLETAWINLAAGAKADVFIALLGSGGDGVIDPAFGTVVAEFK